MNNGNPASWYAVISSDVLFDRQLTADQKILVALISNGMTKKGYCWSTNEYFAECLNCSVRTIQRNLETLEQQGHISREVVTDPETREVKERMLKVNERRRATLQMSPPPMTAVTPPPVTGDMTPPVTGVMDNNIYTNNKGNKEEVFVDADASTTTETPTTPVQTIPPEAVKEGNPIHAGADEPKASPRTYALMVRSQLITQPKTVAEKKFNWDTVVNFLAENPGYPYPEPYMDLWNMYAAKRALPQVETVNETRKRKVARRVQEKAFNFVKILEVMSKSSFLLETWPATFDWLVDNDSNYVKVLEGNYA
jgi:SOS-response transcriptional repressor LexA